MTMKELAEMTGVSASAISRYLNGGSLSEDKRARIRKVIEETGYVPDAAAQSLRKGMTDYVGLIVPKLDSDAVSRVTRGASQVLAKEGYLCLLADTGSSVDTECEYIKLFQNRQVAGIILMATMMTPRHEELIKNSSIPIIVVGQRFRNVSSIYHDDFGAAHDIAQLMLDKGRRKLAYIGVTEWDVAVGQNRRLGVEAAISECKDVTEKLVLATGSFTLESGRQAMKQLLDEGNRPDGVICATDSMAFGAMEELRSRGYRIPEDISVAGMDDNWAGEHILPNLTTVHFYYKTSGETAANHLIEIIQNKDKTGPAVQTMLGYTIKERDSV